MESGCPPTRFAACARGEVMGENNAKVSNRQLIELLTNHVQHVEDRISRVEWLLYGLVLAYVAGWVALVAAVIAGG